MQQKLSNTSFSTSATHDCQTKAGSSGQSTPPPTDSSSSDNQTLWIGAAAALLLGGGAFIAYKTKMGKHDKSTDVQNKQNINKKRKKIQLQFK